MAVYIFATRIYLDSSPTVANASSIGLYNDADNGSNHVFRWIETDISAYSPTYTWKAGIFTPSPIDDITESVDLAMGGNLPSVGGTSVRIGNTLSIGGTMTQFDKTVEAADIRFNGLRCDIIRFEVSSGSLVSADGDIVFRGICGDPKWNEREYAIPVENSLFKRQSNLATVITTENYPNATGEALGKIVPVTFGEFKPEYDANNNVLWNGYAEFIRTANKETIFEMPGRYDTGQYFGSNLLTAAIWDITFDGSVRTIFPIIGDDGTTPTIKYNIKLGNANCFWYLGAGAALAAGKWEIKSFVGQYMFVIQADGNSSDNNESYRRITRAVIDLDNYPDGTVMTITINDVFETNLGGNATASSSDQCWIQIIDIDRNYSADVWPCKNYLSENGLVINSGLNIYSYTDEKIARVTTENTDATIEEKPLQFFRLPQYAYLGSLLGINNELDIDVTLFDRSPDQMDSFIIVPVTSFELSQIPAADVVSRWSLDNNTITYKIADGLYCGAGSTVGFSFNHISGSINDVVDKKHKTALIHKINHITNPANGVLSYIVYFDLPAHPKNFKYDYVYLGLKHYVETSSGDPVIASIGIKSRRFIGPATTLFSEYFGFGNVAIDNILDQYYLDNRENNNRFFYYGETFYVDNGSKIIKTVPGYFNIELENVNTKEKYEAVKQIMVWTLMGTQINDSVNTKLFELAVMFKKTISIKDAIYSPLRGRVYKSTWGTSTGTSSYSSSSSSQSSPSSSSSSSSSSMSFPSSSSISQISSSSSSQSSPSSSSSSSTSCTYGNARRNGCAMIDNPVDILEHTMRLQNWSEQGEVKEWGKEYANNPLIDVSTSEGGFDYEDLDYHKTLRPARQIKEHSRASSVEIAKSLCKQFFMVSYQNPLTGKESISNISIRSLTTPTTTITLADIIGDIGEVIYPEVRNIYPEPIIKYAQNPASGEYEKTIQITNTNAAVYDSSYVVGLTGSTAELMWARGKVLWEATRNIEPIPQDRSELTWYVKDADAVWYLETLYSWMGAINTDGTPEGVVFDPKKRISFSVPYETGKDWFLTQHHNLQLPHQTNSQAIEFAIEKMSKNIKKEQEKVTVEVILYGDTSELEYYVKDSMDAGVELEDWKDSMDKKADVPAQGEDIKDSA